MAPVWRLCREGFATLQEIETHYSLRDLAEANRYLDDYHEARRKAEETAAKRK